MTDEIWEYRLKQIEVQSASDRKEVADLKKRIADFETAEADRERKWLLWGIITLGGVVSGLFGLIWSYRSVIFRGDQ